MSIPKNVIHVVDDSSNQHNGHVADRVLLNGEELLLTQGGFDVNVDPGGNEVTTVSLEVIPSEIHYVNARDLPEPPALPSPPVCIGPRTVIDAEVTELSDAIGWSVRLTDQDGASAVFSPVGLTYHNDHSEGRSLTISGLAMGSDYEFAVPVAGLHIQRLV